MKTATYVRDIEGWRAHAKLYRLSEPVFYTSEDETTDYVIVSAVVARFSGPETFIFPATADGKAINMMELPGSYQGGLNHDEAILGAGYEPVYDEADTPTTTGP